MFEINGSIPKELVARYQASNTLSTMCNAPRPASSK